MLRRRQDPPAPAAAAPSASAPPSAPPLPHKRLGDLLLDEGIITRDQLAAALAEQKTKGGFIGQILVQQGVVKQEDVASCLVKQCKIPHLSLLDYDVGSDVLALIPKEVCQKYNLLPIDKLGRILTVAMVDPLDLEALEAIRAACPDLRIKPILCNWQHYDMVSAKIFGEGGRKPGEVTAASFGLSPTRPGVAKPAAEPAAAPAPAAPAAAAQAAPPAGPAPEALARLLRDGMREAMQEAVRGLAAAVPAAPAAPGVDANALAGALRDALQDSVAALAQELRATPAAPPSPAAAPPAMIDAGNIPQLAEAIRDSVGGAMQEAMAVLLVQLRAATPQAASAPAAAPAMPDAAHLADMIRDSVGGAIQEAMATMVVQMRAIASKPETGAPQEEVIGRVAEALKEAVAGVQQAQATQESRLTEIAEAMLGAVRQTGELMEQRVVAENNLADLRRGGRHASVTPFRDMRGGAAPQPGAEEADRRVLEALESEHPLETLNFDNFFPGNANAFTFQVSKAVSAQPGAEYNPFFLYGHVGVGKTHLISAMGNTILSGHPEARVGYVSASHFARRLADAVRDNAQDAFRENYCHWDVLILDDIQFMGGKVEAQEEFFHIFNVLRQQGRQIIIAGDKAPDRLGLLEQRLVSRFASGIVAELKVPEYETRMRILRHAVAEGGTAVPDEVLGLIAMRVKHDVRKMMGSLRKVTAFAKLVGQEMSVEMAHEILSHLGVEEAA